MQAGAKIVLFDISNKVHSLAATLSSGGEEVMGCQVNITCENDVKVALDTAEETFGAIDILFHSAGVGVEKSFLETTREEWQRIIDIDLTGTFLCCQAIAKRMVPNAYGRIITVASTAAVRGGVGRAAYGAAKGGVLTLTKVMAVELAEFGITVNTLAPGAIDTELVAKMHSEHTRKIYTHAIPQKRYGTPEEVADAAVFLAGEKASYINGHCLAVDGGFLAAGLMADAG
ncbi:SDR family oxidoreductase [Porticoccaceae bacterium]|nr:SDR family oxidoreductase [Porticoccaceae bacterium]